MALVTAVTSGKFVDFLKRNGINEEWYREQTQAAVKIPRLIRFHPTISESLADGLENRSCVIEALSQVEKEAGLAPKNVPWLEGFWSLPQQCSIRSLSLFQEGLVYGIDAASGFIISALSPKPGESVLDLCCAPGAKMCLIADLMKRQGCLVGIDASLQRAQSCASVLRKYGTCSSLETNFTCDSPAQWDCSLIVADGVVWNSEKEKGMIIWDTADDMYFSHSHSRAKSSTPGPDDLEKVSPSTSKDYKPATTAKKRNLKRKINKSMKLRLKRERNSRTPKIIPRAFDRVLVDAECTHDGSIRHLSKYETEGQWGADAFAERFLFENDPGRGSPLKELQRGLISNGFRLLRPGGVLVYSTCSFCKAQNEDIVQWLLDQPGESFGGYTAKLVQVENVDDIPVRQSEDLPGCLRFEPVTSKTSGLFMAKITKI